MGFKVSGRIIYAFACLAFAAYFVYFVSPSAAPRPKAPLKEAFSDIGRWKMTEDVHMEDRLVEALELDDYLFRSFSMGDTSISLYIGYYRSAGKVGAAHSPLVCFPGQGWEISIPGTFPLGTERGKIHAERLIIEKGRHRELLFYWYQSYDRTSGGSFRQKIDNLWTRMKGKPEDNAFVRVSVPVQDDDLEEAGRQAAEFIQDFYPKFHHYITSY